MKAARYTALALILLLLLALSGCSGGGEAEQDPGQEEGQAQEAPGPEAGLDDIRTALYRAGTSALRVADSDPYENRALSAAGIGEALGLVGNAAGGSARAQAEAVAGCGIRKLNRAYRDWKFPDGTEGASSVWLKDEFSFAPAYKKTAEDDYGAFLEETDFGDGLREKVDSWAKEKTGGAVAKLMGRPTEGGTCLLAQAFAFDSAWEEPFEEDAASQFVCESGETRTVSVMKGEADAYFEGEGFKGFIRDFGNGLSFVAVRPDGKVADFLAAHDGKFMADAVSETLASGTISVAMPAFETEWTANLVPLLSDMGMPDAFSASADLPDLAEQGTAVRFSDAIQKTSVKVGKEAAKKEAEKKEPDGSPGPADPDREVILDKAFFYYITQGPGRVPLFAGAVNAAGENGAQ